MARRLAASDASMRMWRPSRTMLTRWYVWPRPRAARLRRTYAASTFIKTVRQK